MEWFLITEITTFPELKKNYTYTLTQNIYRIINVPYGLYKYTGTDWIKYFSKSRDNININNCTVVSERQTKMETDRKIFV